MGKRKTGVNTQAAYEMENRAYKNRKRRLEKRIKNHPNDEMAKKALANISSDYRRKKPYSSVWSKTTRAYAEALGSVGRDGRIASIPVD